MEYFQYSHIMLFSISFKNNVGSSSIVSKNKKSTLTFIPEIQNTAPLSIGPD